MDRDWDSLHELKFGDSPSLQLDRFDAIKSQPFGNEHQDEGQIQTVDRVQVEEPVVTKRELYSYYLYSNSTNGIGPSRYSLTLFQSLVTAAGFDPQRPSGTRCNISGSSGRCVIEFGGNIRSVNSVVLIANAISFSIMTFLYTVFGGSADHGEFDQWILLFLTGIWWASQLALVGVSDSSQWRIAMGLYIVGFSAYGSALVFFSAAFPRLSRNMPEALTAREKLERVFIGHHQEYEQQISLLKNHVSLISSVHYNIGALVTLLLSLAVIIPLPSNNHMVTNWTILVATIYSMGTGVCWFIFQQKRSGTPLPRGKNYLTIGLWSLYKALINCKHLPQTFVYLIASLFLADGVNTTTTLVYIVQGESVAFEPLQLTYLNIAQAGTSVLSVSLWWYIQRHFSLKTKQMFAAATVATVIIPLWGSIGMFTNKIGFHKGWEFWTYNFIVAIFQTPYYSYSVTMMAELTPPGYENMFFGLYGFSNRASSLVGPSIIQAIINNTGSNWSGFPFLFFSTFLAVLIILWKVDIEKGRERAKKWSEKNKK